MPLGDRWKTKLILDVEITASSRERADLRWEQVLEKFKYQTPNVKITPSIQPNWVPVEEENG